VQAGDVHQRTDDHHRDHQCHASNDYVFHRF
jgi:hypothetical protein